MCLYPVCNLPPLIIWLLLQWLIVIISFLPCIFTVVCLPLFITSFDLTTLVTASDTHRVIYLYLAVLNKFCQKNGAFRSLQISQNLKEPNLSSVSDPSTVNKSIVHVDPTSFLKIVTYFFPTFRFYLLAPYQWLNYEKIITTENL